MSVLASIVIRTYNEEKHIDTLLREIYNQDFPNDKFEVIIVDSGSTDKTLDIVQKYPIKLVEIKPEDFTFGYSLNKGIEAAEGRYILMTSAHCYPINNKWINKMINPFEQDNEIVLVYGKQRGKKTTKYSEHQIFKKWFPDKGSGKQNYPFCNNANCAIRKELWEKYKYDETLTGLEDLDWAQEMLNRDYFLFYQSDGGVYHIHDENYSQIFNRYKREAIALKNIFPDTKFSFIDFLVMFASNFLTDTYNALKEGKLIKNLVSIFLFRFVQFWGTYRGHKFDREITFRLKKKFYYPLKVKDKDNNENYILPIRIVNKLKRWFND